MAFILRYLVLPVFFVILFALTANAQPSINSVPAFEVTELESALRAPAQLRWRGSDTYVSLAIDVLKCPDCSGRMRILAAIHPPETTRKILDCLGLPTRAPPLYPAVPESTGELDTV